MTRKLLSAVAVMAAVFFTGSIAAQAADVTFGGQLRPRYEFWNLPANDAQFINMRVRLNVKAKIDDNTSAFIQFQSNTRFGSADRAPNGENVAGGVPVAIGNRSNASDANDTRTDVGLHQAYFTIKNLFGLPVSIQPGRQEVVLDGHRLFGHTGWTQGAQTHDAVKFVHAHDNMTVAYVYSKVFEFSNRGIGGKFAGPSSDDVDDTDAHILWVNMKGMLGAGSSTSGYLVLLDADLNGVVGTTGSADFYTIGFRQAGKAGAISYRGEVYYQTGKSGIQSGTTPTETGDVEAYMLGIRVGYKAANVAMKPSVTLWYDHLSGNNGSDAASGDTGRFNTLFDTGHKFYGFMDFFLGQQARGLHDVAIKIAVKPIAKTTLKVDVHHFARTSSNGAAFAGVSPGARTLGQEIDVTLVHKYSASTKIVAGISHFFVRNALGGVTNEDRDWAYVMFDVKF